MSINMGYCKFENTVAAMRQCLEDDTPNFDEMSRYEKRAYWQFWELIAEYADEAELILEERDDE